jgi:hypothetical protein
MPGSVKSAAVGGEQACQLVWEIINTRASTHACGEKPTQDNTHCLELIIELSNDQLLIGRLKMLCQ